MSGTSGTLHRGDIWLLGQAPRFGTASLRDQVASSTLRQRGMRSSGVLGPLDNLLAILTLPNCLLGRGRGEIGSSWVRFG